MAYVGTYKRRKAQQRREQIKDILLATLATFIASMFFAWVLINWASGCGETFQTASGELIQGECIFHPTK